MLGTVLPVLLAILAYRLYKWARGLPRISSTADKYVLVTGCDTGFGKLHAQRLDKLGFHVFAACLTEKGQQDLKQLCSDRVVTMAMDVTSHDSILKARDVVRTHVGENGELWGLVNNAGVLGAVGHIEWQTREDFINTFNVNLFGMVDVTRTFLPLLKRARGRVVNASSVYGRTDPGSGAYGTSKFAVEGYSDCLRRMLGPLGVSVHILEPGTFLTGFQAPEVIDRLMHKSWDNLEPDVRSWYGEDFFEDAVRVFKEVASLGSTNYNHVVDAVAHCLTAVHPQSRYVCGWDARLVMAPLSWLPTDVGDWVLRILAGQPKVLPKGLRRA
uniref:Retinol dehydrogenase, retinaldehyde reductase n=1 Tax=Branchiostoma floridae TaxID=7739 RepID=C3YI16_BRAFL|eukprot:XP_002604142.1 retinol dehydrogenase, retinaldehyde reductase [Branchiostoma floridae]